MDMKDQTIKQIETLLEDLMKASTFAEQAMKDYDSKENCYPFAFGFMTAFVEDKAQSIKQSLTNLK